MKKMRRFLWIALIALVTMGMLAGCAANDKEGALIGGGGSGLSGADGYRTYDKSSGPEGATYDGGIGDVDVAGEGIETGEAGETNEVERQSGLMTAMAWNDNQYYNEWKALFEKGAEGQQEGGKFADFLDGDWWFDTLHRVKVTVKAGETPVAGATVTFYESDQTALKARTDAKGVAYLFPQAESGRVTVKSGENEGSAEFTAEERDLTVDLAAAQAKVNLIKLMFVVDVTGSMGDELNFLKDELDDVIHRVAATDNQTRIDLALLFYRDDGDEEKFAYADFKTVTDESMLQAQAAFLAKQFADGGGDIPEAVDEALDLAVNKNWGTENATRLIFFVLDAPPHSEQKNRALCASSIAVAAEKGIRVCPVLCSGADGVCEYVARQGAVYTGGTSVFVTDHSGIGNAHLDPGLPNAVVEKLNDLLVRVITGYHTGEFERPVWWNDTAQEQKTE